MADGFNRFNTGGPYFYPNTYSTHARNIHHRNGSPISSSRGLFQPSTDTPSPNRSPGTHSPAHNPYNMFNHGNHRQNHGLINGAGHNYQTQMGLHKGFQTQGHGHQTHHLSSQHQEHGLGGHGGTLGNHQHTISGGALTNTTPHFTPAHLQNGTPDNFAGYGKPPNEHWAEQMREYTKLKMAETNMKPHFYARTTPHVSRLPGGPVSAATARTDVDEHGERRRLQAADGEPEEAGAWDAMDLGGHGLKSLGASIFRHYPHLRKIYFNHNKLTWLPPQIGTMRSLTVLDLSFNDLTNLPPEIGMLTNLKRLLLYENHLDDLPFEIGSLHQLEMLGIEGNPMRQCDYKQLLMDSGTKELVRFLREHAPRTYHLIFHASNT